MVIDMNESKLKTLEQLRAFLEGTLEVEFSPTAGQDRAQRYAHVQAVVRRFGYAGLPRLDKAVVLRYLERTTGYSRQQLTRLVGQALAGKELVTRYKAPRKGFTRLYTAGDVQALAHIDAARTGRSQARLRST